MLRVPFAEPYTVEGNDATDDANDIFYFGILPVFNCIILVVIYNY